MSGGGRAPLVAAARWARGRVVVFGHTGYFGRQALRSADTARLLGNAIRWSASSPTPRVGCLSQPALAQALRPGLQVRVFAKGALTQALGEVDVLCLAATDLKTPAERAQVAAFAEAGGGVVLSGLGWGWQQLNPKRSLREDHPGNLLLSEVGLAWADGYSQRSSREGFTLEAPGRLLAAGPALELLLEHAEGKARPTKAALEEAGRTVILAGQTLRQADRLLRPTLARLEAQGNTPIPSATAPLRAEEGLSRVLLSLQCARLARDDSGPAHPASVEFPGPVPSLAPRLNRKLVLNGRPGWQSTGLYAAPGVPIELSTERAIPSLRVRIGAHTDRLYHKDAWGRAPEITLSRAMPGLTLTLSNPFGGLIYLEAEPETQGTIKVSRAVAAPRFVLGQTRLETWRRTIRRHPAPWAELASDKIILTVPSRHVRELGDPQALMTYWDTIADACADLAGIPAARPRPERYVADVQLSAGYMHAGYPIMTHLDAAEGMTDLASLSKAGNWTWGLFHELGHNHQVSDWTFEGTGEVTCNLFTLYVLQEVCGVERPRAELYGPARSKRLQTFFSGPRSFGTWKGDPFLALLQYMQLQEAFGWEPFKRVFREYRALPKGKRPRTDAERRDQWLIRFSRAVGVNLGPFFAAWGVPTSEAARASLRDLPDWLLGGLPR
tara:strand:- start:491 stop:2494 length:2004 start_codon:yes stop_codon:yes gene_type:complete